MCECQANPAGGAAGMTIDRCIVRALIAGITLLAATTAHSTECGLNQVASVAIVRGSDGLPLIPVTVAGTPTYLKLSLANTYSYLLADFAAEQNLRSKPLPSNVSIVLDDREPIRNQTSADFQFDQIVAKNFAFLVAQKFYGTDIRQKGEIGLGFLSAFDVELDLAHNRLNLFSQDHCSGKVIYWSNSAVGVIPLERQPSGHIVFPVELDGHALKANLNPSEAKSYLALSKASALFGLTVQSPNMLLTPRGEVDEQFQSMDHFRHPFGSLSSNGIVIRNPEIYISDDSTAQKCDGKTRTIRGGAFVQTCYGNADFTLGMQEIQALRLFLAFKEKKIYFTAAESN
jgi:hypothetical protein